MLHVVLKHPVTIIHMTFYFPGLICADFQIGYTSVAGFTSRITMVRTISLEVGFVVERVSLGHPSPPLIPFTPSISFNSWCLFTFNSRRIQLKCDGTRRRTDGEVKGKQENGVGNQKRHMTAERRLALAVQTLQADVHSSPASSPLNWRRLQFKWTRPFRRKTKSGFCACAITFQTQSTTNAA
jgi:hypothetical protein